MERTRDIEFQGKKFQIGKLPASDAMYVILKILEKALPKNLEQQVFNELKQDVKDNNVVAPPMETRVPMTHDEIDELMMICMKVVKFYQRVGEVDVPMAVVLRNGKYNQAITSTCDVQYDLMLSMALLANVLIFNAQSFFAEGAFNALLESLPDLAPANM